MLRLISGVYRFIKGYTEADDAEAEAINPEYPGASTKPVNGLISDSESKDKYGNRLRRSFSGVVTCFRNDSGLVDDEVFFSVEHVDGGIPLEGCQVLVQAVRAGVHSAWTAEKVEILKTWEDEVIADDMLQLVAEIRKITRGKIFLSDNLQAGVATLKVGYHPAEGDIVEVELSKSSSNFTKVRTIKPLREQIVQGVVTDMFNGFGLVNGYIEFTFRSCAPNFRAHKGAQVCVLAVECRSTRGGWRAVKTMPIQSKRAIAMQKEETTSDKGKLESLLMDKCGIVIKKTMDFGEVEKSALVSVDCSVRNDGASLQHFLGIRLPTLNDQFSIVPPPMLEGYFGSKQKFLAVATEEDQESDNLFARAEIKPDETKTLTMLFSGRYLGKAEHLIVFVFQGFEIGRVLTARVINPLEHQLQGSKELLGEGSQSQRLQNRKKHRSDLLESNLIPGQKPVRSRKIIIPRRLGNYPVPTSLKTCVLQREDIEARFPYVAMPLTPSNYAAKFKVLLHVEEVTAQEELSQFDLSEVSLRRVGEFFAIEVPGLAEGRPSLLLDDRVALTYSGCSTSKGYEGFIYDIRAQEILVKFNPVFHEMYREERCNINFLINRTTIRRCHQAAEAAPQLGEEILFPGEVKCSQPALSWRIVEGLHFNNQSLNERQRQAVSSIVAAQGRPCPYILYGPPGTGKTVTMVEAILQIFLNIKHSRILISAPSNSATDRLAILLHETGLIRRHDMVRLNAKSRRSEIPDVLQPYCLSDSENIRTASRRRILVATCSTAALMYSLNLPPGHFTHVFVDEAGQATEPECLIPVILVAGYPEGEIVLAGDPHQLGPVLRSSLTDQLGLAWSLLARIMDEEPYQPDFAQFGRFGGYNPIVITKLLCNYRSHPSLLELPSALFYNNELVARAPTKSTHCFVGSSVLLNKDIPFIFHGVRGHELREGDSPSWLNTSEAVQVLHYAQSIVEAHAICGSEMGVITPYRKQVEKIRKLLDTADLSDIKVGTVEEFQGQERRIIIISTVRSPEDDNNQLSTANLGFLRNQRRFNVSITRAKALLVVIGNPYVLCQDVYWCTLLQKAVVDRCYVGCELPALQYNPTIKDCFERALHLLQLSNASPAENASSAEDAKAAENTSPAEDPSMTAPQSPPDEKEAKICPTSLESEVPLR